MRVFVRNMKGRDYLYFGGYKQDIYLGNIDEAKFNENNLDKTLELIYSKIGEHKAAMNKIFSHLPSDLQAKYKPKYDDVL